MAFNPFLPIAGLGALVLFFMSRDSSAKTTPEGAPPGGHANTVPPALLEKVQTALGRLGVNPGTGQLSGAADAAAVSYGQAVVNELKAGGWNELAGQLQSYVSQAAAMLPGPYTPAAPSVPSGPRPTSELSDAQRERMAEALGRLGVSPATGKLSGAADASAIQFATQVIGELKAAGFEEAASILRSYTDEAAKSVQTPKEAAPIAQAAAGMMTKEQAEYVARVLALERDPNKIGLLIDWLKKLPPSEQRDTFIQMAQALALQLEAANITTDTLDKIDQVIQATPEPPAPPAPPVYVPPAAPPAPKPLPERPTTVPAQPVPQKTPAPLTDAEIVARQLLTHLSTLQNKHGIKGAKGKEDKMLVKKFQALTGIAQDGSAGPATFILLASKGAVSLPYVYYWPKAATAATVAEYRSHLEKIAQALEKNGRRDEANTLRVSIARERGEGGINGSLFGAPAAAPKPAAPKPTAAPAPSPNAATSSPAMPGGIAVDPFPNWRILKRGMSGADVKQLQLALLNPGANKKIYNVGTPDGIFGAGTETQVKAFQKDAGISADGMAGSGTRLALRRLGKW
jgi:peptidoglycan hydrolase-like protein with peptidoglycan-binding domain